MKQPTKTCRPNPKIWDHNKCVRRTFLGIEILNKTCFIGFLRLQFFWLDILVSEMVFSKNAGLFYVWSTSKYFYLCWRSRFGNISFPNFDLQILDIIAAFLAFMALKVKPKVSPKFLTLVDYNGEKIMKIQFFPYLAFGANFKNIFGLLKILLRSLMPKNSSGMQKSYFWTEFLHKKLTNQKCHWESLCTVWSCEKWQAISWPMVGSPPPFKVNILRGLHILERQKSVQKSCTTSMGSRLRFSHLHRNLWDCLP